MTFLQAASAGLRGYVISLIALFLLLYLGSVLLDGGVQDAAARKAMQQPAAAEGGGECDWFSGRWVHAGNATGDPYSCRGCPYMMDEVACEKFGRDDLEYKNWRWQPHGCDLPSFSAERLLEELRGKRMVFVGDSLNRNQWVSMVCMLEKAVPDRLKSRVFNGSLISFTAVEYNARIDFYWSPLLLESNCDDPVDHRVPNRIIRAGAIEKHWRHWMDADILVFNSYLWWKKPNMKMKVLHGEFGAENPVLEEMEMSEGFDLALGTWSEHLKANINPDKTRIFFVGPSPVHLWALEWGGAPDRRNCYAETEPIARAGYASGGTDYGMLRKVEAAVAGLRRGGIDARLLNITGMSEYRKDGHPSVYRRQYAPLSEEQLRDPRSYADCTHWCLPGVPDVWNHILFVFLTST